MPDDSNYWMNPNLNVWGYKVRKPYESELDFFKKSPHVGGMAADDGAIIVNPYSPLSNQEKVSVARLEAARLWLRENNVEPDFELTDEQKKIFSDPFYADNYGKKGNEKLLRQTIISRLLVGDPSAGMTATPEQKQWARMVEQSLRAREQ